MKSTLMDITLISRTRYRILSAIAESHSIITDPNPELILSMLEKNLNASVIEQFYTEFIHTLMAFPTIQEIDAEYIIELFQEMVGRNIRMEVVDKK